jgi:predicted Rossmann fold flavoprotein
MANRIAIAGGGAAGFFAAIAAAEANPKCEVSIYERTSHFLAKVRISGGGRCNVTQALFEPREFVRRYPRGERELIGALHRFSPSDTVAWFESRGVPLKAERDGRMFPVTNRSETVVDCLVNEARAAGVRLFANNGVESAHAQEDNGFSLNLSDGSSVSCDRLLLATGGARSPIGGRIARALRHSIDPPVPSLFSLHEQSHWLGKLAGISVSDVEIAASNLRQRGPLLITHNGVSGPVVLQFSAWGARILHALEYRFVLRVNWLPRNTESELRQQLQTQRQTSPRKRVVNLPADPIPLRLWEALCQHAGIPSEATWATLSRDKMNSLVRQLHETDLSIDGKSLNKEEFVTCGGVRLREIDFRTLESKVTPGLYFAGELLDIDGITGGFNFQAAWTTGWIAGRAMASAAS